MRDEKLPRKPLAGPAGAGPLTTRLRSKAMNNADLIVRMLRDAGARHAFGIPSGNVLPLLEAAPQRAASSSC